MGDAVNEALIEAVVRAFYQRVRRDELLGPVFERRIVEWEPHLQRMFAFWSSVLLATGRYHGQPMQRHAVLPIDAQHFDRWLELFERTAMELCAPDVADMFIDRARRIATSLEMGRAVESGQLLARGQRFVMPQTA